MQGPRVLVAGAGISGSVLAYWLAKGGARVTVIEKAPAVRTAGQGVEVEGTALEVVQRMGLEDAIRGKVTGEKGFACVDGNNKIIAAFDIGNKKTDLGFTSELEITRGALVQTLYHAADAFENVEFRFDCAVVSLIQTDRCVEVTYTNSIEPESFDFLVAADGLRSKTRDLILGPQDPSTYIRSLDAFAAYFSIPKRDQDHPRSRIYNTTGRRTIFIRPRDQDLSSANLVIAHKDPRLCETLRQGVAAQKAVFAERFQDAGWEAPRVIEEMNNAEDFYLQEIAQVRLDGRNWYQGRCALVGDAAYCPSPITGSGVVLAVAGAYVLAGEIISLPNNPARAFEEYEKKFRAFVEEVQYAPKFWLKLFNPQSKLGVWLLRLVQWFTAWSGVIKLFGGLNGRKFELPDYPVFD